MQQNPGFHSLHSWELWIFTSPMYIDDRKFCPSYPHTYFFPKCCSKFKLSSWPLGRTETVLISDPDNQAQPGRKKKPHVWTVYVHDRQ